MRQPATTSDLLWPDWSALPAPTDDGAAAHLDTLELPPVRLASSQGDFIVLSELGGRTVFYIYPMTGKPGVPLPADWDFIPGARGCTPQACAFRHHFAMLRQTGVDQLFGVSTQSRAEQIEAAERLHLPFPLLSDERGLLTTQLKLPTFEAGGMMRLKRLTMIIEDRRIVKVFYPVFPPDRSAADVLEWLSTRSS